MELNWVNGFEIRVETDGKETCISANRAGLLSLASHLQALAEDTPGCHIHLDAYNSLSEGSTDLVIEKTD
ncbi:MAG: hypothetical protein IJ206_06130 [Oscillospiraceae bacterium]|nr:hypothetical protein [Oscillospiraceae bacterium]